MEEFPQGPGGDDSGELRRCRARRQTSIYAEMDSSETGGGDDDSEFTDTEEDPDDVYTEENYRKSRKKKTGTQQKRPPIGRPTDGLYIRPKRSRTSDSDEWDGTPIRSMSENPIAQRRARRAVKDVNYHDDLPAGIFFDETTDSATPELLDAPPLTGIEKIFGENDEGKFFVRLMRSSNAEAQFMTREEIEARPGGSSHLSVFDELVEEYGKKPNPSIPQLQIPATETEEQPELVLDHIITYNKELDCYLVLWRDVPYEDATWEHEVKDEHALEVFRKREEFIPRAPRPLQRGTFKDYGTEPGCIPLPVYKNGNELRPYQIEALNWLRFHYHTQTNSILADEMGLGKTVMCISLLHDIVTKCDVPGPFLIVAPLGTLPNWQREFENWTDIQPVILHGSKPGRDVLTKYELFYDSPHETVPKVQVVVTNVETVTKELEVIQSINWHFVIIDEAHRLKNIKAKIYGMLYSLNMDHILLMTGTPIQNNLDEIFALLHFIAPTKFKTVEEFRARHGNMDSVEDVQKLQEELKPYMLRRKKIDVEKSIAGKEETIVEVELTRIQKFYYRLLIDRKADALISGHSTVRVSELNNLAMQLRKVCNHPFLLPDAEAEIVKPGENPVDAMVASCGKMVFVDKLLAKLSKTNTKVLIFSQMVRVLNILEDFLRERGYKYERLDGRVHGAERQASIDRFNDPNSEALVFLLCTKAGGVGLNLTAASVVVIYDSDWNPQNDLQAQARCHRIGQTHDVQVYRLVTRNTYENEMFLRASMKLGLDQAILDSRPDGANNMSAKEIEMLLKKGAYHILNDDDETEMDKFVAEDIDQILEGRTRKLQSSSANGESAFSKANFVVEKDGEQLDLNDEHFWEKMIPKEQRRAARVPTTETARMRKSRSSDIYAIASDDEEEYGSTWSTVKRDRLLSLMLQFGYGRWPEIHEKVKSSISWEMMIDGSAVILFLIGHNLDHPEDLFGYLFEKRSLDLTSRQRKLLTTELFSNKRWREQLKKHSQQHCDRLCRIRAIGDWIDGGCKKIVFDPSSAPKIWKADYDEKMLKAVWKHGWGDWNTVLGDTEIWEEDMKGSSKVTSALLRRLNSVCDAIMDGRAFDVLLSISSALKELTSDTIKRLLTGITEIGLLWEEVDAMLKLFDVDVDQLDIVGPAIVNCARIVAALDPKATQSAIRAAIRGYSKEAEVLASSLSTSVARKMRDNINWIERVRNFVATNNLDELKFEAKPDDVPEWWDSKVHSKLVLQQISTHGLWNLPEFVLETEEFSKNIDEADVEYITSLKARVERHGSLRQVKGDWAFLLQEDLMIQLVEDIIESLGGWNVPSYIDVPDNLRRGMILPFSYGNSNVETLGQGDILEMDGYLYKVGFRARVQHKNVGFRCTVLNPNKFEVWKSDRARWTGKTPGDAWAKADTRFDGDGMLEFGIASPICQYGYFKWVDGELPEGFVPPNVNFYQTEVEERANKKKKAPAKKNTKPPPKKSKKKKSRKDESEDDTDESDDFDYQ